MLKFIISGQTIKRTDANKIVQYAQEYPEADFNFDSDWNELEKTAQWNMADETYDTPIENGRAVVPWELLRNSGILNVNVVGVVKNKVITTNTVSINVIGCGIVGGMVGGKPSESFYTALKAVMERHEEYINGLEADRKNRFDINDLLSAGDIIQPNGISVVSGDVADERAVIDIDPETGIRMLNNMPKDRDWYIKIGQGDEKGDVRYGIMYRSGSGDFWIMCGDSPIMCLTPNKAGTDNVINGNETLTINAGNGGYISFGTANAGINYTAATWTNNLKQLDINTSKGVNIQANNNSYFQSGEKKLVLGNDFNQIEFRTDGIAKFKGTVNASDYQIGGNSVKDKLNGINNVLTKHNSYLREIIALTCRDSYINVSLLEELCSDADEIWDVGITEGTVNAYFYNEGICYIIGNGEIKDNAFSCEMDGDVDLPMYEDAYVRGKKITRVYIAYGITKIGDGAFREDRGLESIIIPKSVTSIGDAAFYSCVNLTDITIPDSVTSIGTHILHLCRNLVNAAVSNNINKIEEYMFAECNSLTSIIIPDSVASLENWAFSGCSSLASITIPESVTSIGSYAFSGIKIVISINKSEGSITGSPWGARSADIIWNE